MVQTVGQEGPIALEPVMDLAVISIEDEAKVMGEYDDSTEVVTLIEYLRVKHFQEIVFTDCVDEEWPDFPRNFKTIAGILYIPLSRGGKDFIAFLRKEQLKVG